MRSVEGFLEGGRQFDGILTASQQALRSNKQVLHGGPQPAVRSPCA